MEGRKQKADINSEGANSKKQRRLQQYRSIWEKDYPDLRPVQGNPYKGKCVLCVGKAGEGFSISHGGICDVKQHFSSTGHKQRQKSSLQASLMKSFMKVNSSEADMVSTRNVLITLLFYMNIFIVYL